MQQQLIADQRTWLGTRFFEVVRRAIRRDISAAGTFFGVPQGQIAYVVGSIQKTPLHQLCQGGLPYRIEGISALMEGQVEERLDSMQLVDPHSLEGWEREAYDFGVDHFWCVQSWAQKDLGLAALMAGMRKCSEAAALAEVHPRVLKKLAAATYGRIRIEQSMCMQMALLFADADASPDRVAIARSGCRILAAA